MSERTETRARRRIREAVESRGYKLVSLEWEPTMTDIVVTADEANRLATGLTGAAAAERADAAPRERPFVPPPRETRLASAHLHVEADAMPRALPYGKTGGAVLLGTLSAAVHLHGEWDVLEATLVAALEAVRVARTGPVGA